MDIVDSSSDPEVCSSASLSLKLELVSSTSAAGSTVTLCTEADGSLVNVASRTSSGFGFCSAKLDDVD